MKIKFTGMKSLPMYGNAVEALYLDIDGVSYVVREVDKKPQLLPVEAVDKMHVSTRSIES